MSESEDQGGAGRREVAYRLFAAEFEDADFSYSESDEERAPNYVVSPTGGRVNRLFVVGVLTEVESASEDVLRARIVDPTGAFVVYAGQYQPDAQTFFERADPPMFVAVTGKARTFQPDDSDVTYTSVRPENVNEVDAETRDRWTVGTTRQTLDRVRTTAHALRREERGDELRAALEAEGVDSGLAAGIPLAVDHYGTTPAYLDAVRHTAVQAIELVADERDEVDPHSASPDAPGDADLATLAGLDVVANVGGETADLGGGIGDSAGSSAESVTDSEPATAASEPATAESGDESPAETDPVTENSSDAPSADAQSEPTTADESTDSATAETTTESAASAESEPASTESTATESEPEETVAAGEDTADEVETDADDAGAVSAGGSPAGPADVDAGADDLDDFDPDEFELDNEEREQIEEEYGTDFQSGSKVGEPGEAGIETPDSEEQSGETEADEPEPADSGASASATEADPPSTESTSEPAASDASSEPDEAEAGSTEEETAADEQAEDVDTEDAVMDAMREHDDDGGAHADDIVDAVTTRIGADEDEVRDAIQDALMDGRCYEPDSDVYKPI